MITSDNDFALYEGSTTIYALTAIVVSFSYDSVQQTFLCEIYPAVVAASTSVVASHAHRITKAAVDAKTGSGTNPSDKLSNQVDQVVKDYLAGITENSGVTFTVV